MQGEYGKIIGGRIIQDGSEDGKDNNGQLESYPIFSNIPLRFSACGSFFRVDSRRFLGSFLLAPLRIAGRIVTGWQRCLLGEFPGK